MDHLRSLAEVVKTNLDLEQDWSQLAIHISNDDKPLPRPAILGLPPKRLYIHPDDQINMIKAQGQQEDGTPPTIVEPELEWVLPFHMAETSSISTFAAVFDCLPSNSSVPGRAKRLVLAIVHDDSTVVYYIMHDGLVKPRQN